MRRIFRYELLVFAIAVISTGGCSKPATSELADARDDSEASQEIVLPDLAEAISLMDEGAGGPTDRNGTPADGSADKNNVEIADGQDADTPRRREPATPRIVPRETQNSLPAEGKDGETKRGADGDDPKAPFLKREAVEKKDELNNGRDPAAQPIPEAQRVAVETQIPIVDDGRGPATELGTPVSPDPVTVKPATPEPPTAATLADLSETIQALDKDLDGQIGLYEWPREKLAEFKKYDSNQDGFLTAAELIAGQKKVSKPETPQTDAKPVDKVQEGEQEKAGNKAKPVIPQQPPGDQEKEADQKKAGDQEKEADQEKSSDQEKSDASTSGKAPSPSSPAVEKPAAEKPAADTPPAADTTEQADPEAPAAASESPADTSTEDKPKQGS